MFAVERTIELENIKKRYFDKEKTFKIIDLLLLCLLIASFLHIAYLVFMKLDPYALHSDIANENSYRLECFKQKTFFPKGFSHNQESLMSRPVLVYALFYAITHDFMLSYECEIMFMLLLQLGALYFLLSQFSISRHAKLTSLCMYIIWQHVGVYRTPSGSNIMGADYALFWPMDAYSVYLVFAYVMIGLFIKLLDTEFSKNNKKRIAILVLAMMLISALIGYTSPRYLIALYAPIMIICGFRLFFKYINNDVIQIKDVLILAFTLLLIIVNAFFYLLLLKQHGQEINASAPYIQPVANWLNWDNLTLQLSHIFSSLGIFGDGSLKSLPGVIFVVRCCFAFFILTSFYYLFTKQKENNEQEKRSFILQLSIWSFLFVFTYMTITRSGGGGATRYYFVFTMLIPVVCGLCIHDWTSVVRTRKNITPVTFSSLALACLFFITVISDYRAYSGDPSTINLVKITEYMENNDVHYVIGSFWNCGIIKGFSNGKIETIHSDYGNGIVNMTPYHWLIDNHLFYDSRMGVKEGLLLTDEEEKNIFDQNMITCEMINKYSKKVYEIGNYNLYELYENPFTLYQRLKVKKSVIEGHFN